MKRVYSQSGYYPRMTVPRDPRWPYPTCRIEEGGGNQGQRRFSFRLVDAATGGGVQGAAFRLTQSGVASRTATSNAQGVVEFSPLPTGSYQLAAEKPAGGYARITARYAVNVDAAGSVWVNGVLAQGFTIRSAALPASTSPPQARAGNTGMPSPERKTPARTMDARPRSVAAPAQAAVAGLPTGAVRIASHEGASGATGAVPTAGSAAPAIEKAEAPAPAKPATPAVAEAVKPPQPVAPTAATSPAVKPVDMDACETSPAAKPTKPAETPPPSTVLEKNAPAVVTGEWISYGNRVVLVSNNSYHGAFDSPVTEVGIKYGFGDPDMEWHAMMNGPLGCPFDAYIPVSGNGLWYYAAFVKTEKGDTYFGKTESARYP